MRKSEIDPRFMDWAKLLVNHSLGSQFKKAGDSIKEKLVIVNGEVVTEPLMLACAHAILEAGGYPSLNPYFSGYVRGCGTGLPDIESGTETQRTHIPAFREAMFNEAGAQIYLLGGESPHLFAPYQEGVSQIRKANKPLADRRLSKPWVLTLFPTKADSVVEGFPTLEEYTEFLFSASVIDYEDLRKKQESLKEVLQKTRVVKMVTYDRRTGRQCELELEIGNRKTHNDVESCIGTHNVADGEVFTSPNWQDVNGEVVLNVPVMYNGVELGDVYLKIRDGQILEHRAEKGQDALTSIIETDEGSHRIGEVAFGTNPGVRPLKSPLYAEKIGGTMHLAIGASYADRYPEVIACKADLEREIAIEGLVADKRLNKSAQHVDIPTYFKDPRHGEKVFLDDVEYAWDNKSGLWRAAA